MVCPVVQDAFSFPDRFLVAGQPAPAQQLVSDARLLADKADLGGKGVGIEVRQLGHEGRAPRIPELSRHFPEEAHHTVEQFPVIHVEKSVFQPRIDLPPGCAHHGAKSVISPECHRDRIMLGKTFCHRMHPGDIAQRLFRNHRTDPPGGQLAVDRGIDIVDGHPVTFRVRQRCDHHMAVVGVGQRFRPRFADAERANRDLRIDVGIVLRRRPIQGRQRGICRPPGK